MGSDFTYTPTTGTVVGVMAALTVFTGIVNSLSTYWVGLYDTARSCSVKLSDADCFVDGEDDKILRHLPHRRASHV